MYEDSSNFVDDAGEMEIIINKGVLAQIYDALFNLLQARYFTIHCYAELFFMFFVVTPSESDSLISINHDLIELKN